MKIANYLKKAAINLIKPVTREYINKINREFDRKMEKDLKEIERNLKDLEARKEVIQKNVFTTNQNVIMARNRADKNSRDMQVMLKEQLAPELYKHAISQWYLNVTGDPLNLDEPKGYNEKIQWLKLYDGQNDIKTKLADKLQVREYVKEKTSENYLIPVYKKYRKAEEIDFNELPDKFVLKANHGCGYNIIVLDKNCEDLNSIKKRCGEWLRENYAFRWGYEMHYNDIPRRIFAEEYIGNGIDSIPDYKFWCFDGKVKYICVVVERNICAKMAFYDTDWNKQPFVYSLPMTEKEIEKPENLEEMITVAEKLAEGFPHVRVDLYRLEDGSIKFGEMTFTSASGVCSWDPPETNLMMGALLPLPLTDKNLMK